MEAHRILRSAAVAAAASFGFSSPIALAQAAWDVEGRLVKEGGKKADDLSGIACATASGFPRDCLVIDDETTWAQWVTLEDGTIVAGDTLPLIDETFDGEALELDGEGAAFGDGAFYVVGSHGAPRNASGITETRKLARLRADSHLFRIVRGPGGIRVDDSLALMPVILVQPGLRDHAARPLDENGVTIEGLAALGPDTFIGFREPVLGADDQAAVLQLGTASLFGGEADAGKLHLIGLGAGQGVRDLAPLGQDLLILAGPGPDRDGTYAVFRWAPASDAPARLLGEVPCSPDQGGKPEVILPLDLSGDTLRLLVLTDGPNYGNPHECSLPWEP